MSAEFVAAMEDVIDLYEEPYERARPLVCFDESPKQLIAEIHEPIRVEPGVPARYDTEYERKGVCDLMMICEPSGESLFFRKLLWAPLPNKRQKLRDR